LIKKSVAIALLILLVIPFTLSGCDYITGAALSPNFISPLSLPPYSDITPQLANTFLMLSSVQIRFIDVRTPAEYTAGHIPSAINVDYNASNFKDQISMLNRNVRYTVYCQTGYRSNLARKVMQELGFKYVFNINGGFNAWVAAELPVEK
jgi:phage shock protein E